MYKFFSLFTALCTLLVAASQEKYLPSGFVYVDEIIPDLLVEMRYEGINNFMGVKVTGYEASRVILTEPAALALEKVQKELKNSGYCLKVFDAYRPQQAVNHFIKWAREPADTLKKQEFYPNLNKNQLFRSGYIASRSGHSRGSTVDLTIVHADTGESVDMGSAYDFFGEISHYNTTLITNQQKENREMLKQTMRRYGFHPYSKEWWHFTYRPEMFPDTYFDFIVK